MGVVLRTALASFALPALPALLVLVACKPNHKWDLNFLILDPRHVLHQNLNLNLKVRMQTTCFAPNTKT